MNPATVARPRRAALCAAVALVLVAGAAAAGAQVPAFEAATVKLAAPGAVRNRVLQPGPNRLSIAGMTLSALIYAAYGNGGFNTAMRVTGGPDWVNTTVFAIEGIAPAPASPRQMRLMLQALLADRFALTLRDSAQAGDSPVYDVLSLVVDRADGTLGPNIRKWDGTCPAVVPAMVLPAPRRPLVQQGDRFVVGPASEADDPAVPYCPTGYRPGGMRIDGATMATVAEMLSLPPGRAQLGMFTQDRTGLTDRYTLELDFLFPVGPAGAAQAADAGSVSLSTAVREQWGLRLVPGKGPLRVMTIERAELPAGN
jgi:uncharacterized protein (TIGR03435 family)